MLNLDLTVAVTHNYCATSNFDAVWRHTRKGRPKLSAKWLAALQHVRPCVCQAVMHALWHMRSRQEAFMQVALRCADKVALMRNRCSMHVCQNYSAAFPCKSRAVVLCSGNGQ